MLRRAFFGALLILLFLPVVALIHPKATDWARADSREDFVLKGPVFIPGHAEIAEVEVMVVHGQGITDIRLGYRDRGTDGDKLAHTGWIGGGTSAGRSESMQVPAETVLHGIECKRQARLGLSDIRLILRQRDALVTSESAWLLGDQAGEAKELETPAATEVFGLEVKQQPGQGIVDYRLYYRDAD